MPLSRKQFVGAAAAGLGATSLTSPVLAADEPGERTPLHFHIMRPGEYDHAKMQTVLGTKAPFKQVFQASSPLLVAPGIASIYIHMQNSMNAHEFSFGFGRNAFAALGVLLGASVVFALNDAAWARYGFGDALKLAPSNSYYKATSDLAETGSPDRAGSIYQDWSAQAVLHRGGRFWVCHNAMTAVAALFSQKAGLSPEAALADLERSLLPGFDVVPAGVAAIDLAQHHGFTYFAVV